MAITRNLSIFLHRRERYGTYLYFLLLEPLFGLRWIVRLHHEAEKETTDQPSHYSTAQIQFFILFHLPPEPRFDLLSAALHPYLDISQLKIGVQYRAHGKCMCMHRGLPATCSSTWKKRWVISDSQVANPNNWTWDCKRNMRTAGRFGGCHLDWTSSAMGFAYISCCWVVQLNRQCCPIV